MLIFYKQKRLFRIDFYILNFFLYMKHNFIALVILTVFGLSSPFWGVAQNKSVLESEKFGQTIQENDLRSQLFFLASDPLEGRETGTHGQRVAAQYIASRFMQIGLLPGNGKSYFQDFNVASVTLNESSFSIGKNNFDYRKDYFCINLADMPQTLSTNWAFAGYGIESDNYNNLSGMSLSGKNILILGTNQGKPITNLRMLFANWLQIMENLQSKGAESAWMIVPDSVYNRINIYGNFSTLNLVKEEKKSMPVFFISEKMGNLWLQALSKRYSFKGIDALLQKTATLPEVDFTKEKLSYKASISSEKIKASNVLGYLEGTDKKEELIVITAHYDHLGIQNGEVYNGADDDGSGTVTVLELAEAFAKAAAEGKRPRRSILFMTVSGEEKGLWGSEFYTENPVFPLQKTVANLNIDMIGRVDKSYAGRKDSANYVYIIGANKISTELDSINKAVNNASVRIVLDEKYNDENDPERFYYRSDHYNFAKNGIPVIFYFTGVHKDYHKPTDDIDKINFTKMVKIGKLIFGTAWELANKENRIRIDVRQEN